jgi:hypothetical protein
MINAQAPSAKQEPILNEVMTKTARRGDACFGHSSIGHWSLFANWNLELGASG